MGKHFAKNIEDISICFDSEYAILTAMGVYGVKKNQKLVQSANMWLQIISTTNILLLWHVKGHSMNEWNETADFLADRGAKGEISSNIWNEFDTPGLTPQFRTFWNRSLTIH